MHEFTVTSAKGTNVVIAARTITHDSDFVVFLGAGDGEIVAVFRADQVSSILRSDAVSTEG